MSDPISERHIPRIVLVRGDITEQVVGVIVNAANSSLMGGGGVDGAIHRAGGPDILEECRTIRGSRGPLPPGEAVATTAGHLHAERVIHTVGPIWAGGAQGEAEVLSRAYRSCLEIAAAEGLRTIAFPSISTGAYGYPTGQAAEVAVATVVEYLRDYAAEIDEVRFVLFDEATMSAYKEALDSAAGAGLE